ncbi:MAG: hypothetical protein PVG43_00715, partial [Nitrosopumilaceae archaeon]
EQFNYFCSSFWFGLHTVLVSLFLFNKIPTNHNQRHSLVLTKNSSKTGTIWGDTIFLIIDKFVNTLLGTKFGGISPLSQAPRMS